ncbi:MAG: hypothetical protein IJI67_07105 [Clostridia bacterium]|nr:hypothetical protein [Clostridia bacterium]
MQELEQAKVNKDAQKKALIGNGILLFVLIVGIILAIFAWFNTMDDRSRARGVNIASNDNLDIRFNTYAGWEQANGTIVYDTDPLKNLNNELYNEDVYDFVLVPGERQYFKTIISNYTDSEHTGDFILQSITVNAKLITKDRKACISFASNLENDASQQAYDLAAAADYYDGGILDPTKKVVYSQSIYDNMTIAAGTVVSGQIRPSSTTVYWYVTLNGDAVDNDAMGEHMMRFKRIKFLTSE